MNTSPFLQTEVLYKSFKQCLLITLSVAIGTFSLSYNTYILNGPLEQIKIWLEIHKYSSPDFLEGLIQTAFNVGGLIGCLIGFAIVKTTSRRLMLFLIDFCLILGTAGLNIKNLPTFILFRTITGIGGGLTTLVTPMFLKEIIPDSIYGVLGGQNLVMLSLGTITQSLAALGFSSVSKGQLEVDMSYWHYYLLPPIIISSTRSLLLLLYFRHESPIYTIQKNRINEAQNYLSFIYKDEAVHKILAEYQEAVQKRVEVKKLPAKRFSLGILINVFYSNSGITPITSYSTFIFQKVATTKVAQVLTIGMSVFKFIFYSIGAHLTQKFGRRKPLIIGTIILAIVLGITSFTSYINENPDYEGTALKSFSVVMIIVAVYLYFMVFFNTFGTIIPLYTPEILSGTYLTIALINQWIFNILVTLFFPVIRDKFGIYMTFLYYGAMMGIAAIYFYFAVKETQNLTENQINDLWRSKSEVTDTDIYQSI